jgi:hypothetical protein
MEETFAEQIVPGTFIRVQAEGLIAPKGVSFGNVGIVGTTIAAKIPDPEDSSQTIDAPNAFGVTNILSSLEDAQKVYGAPDAFSAKTLNLMRAMPLLFANGARTVYARGLAAAADQTAFGAAVAELMKEDINILIAPELSTDDAKTVLGGAVETGENNGRDVIAVIGCDASTIANIKGQITANKRFVMAAPGIVTFDSVAKANVTLTGNYTAAALAGLISSLAPQSSPTNKVLPAVGKLSAKFSYGELKDLLQSNVLPLEDRQGIRVVRGITTEGAAFSQITTRRIVDYAKAGIRQVSGAFIGKLNNERVRKALQGALDSFLTTMIVDESLTDYTLQVTATRADEIAGRCVVNVAMQPTFSIDYIRVTLALS